MSVMMGVWPENLLMWWIVGQFSAETQGLFDEFTD
jgi:hypothetical protein